MASPQNLTDRLAHLRERGALVRPADGLASPPPQPQQQPKPPAMGRRKPTRPSTRERPMSVDLFSLFVYTLLTICIGGQLFIVASLDLF